MCGIVLYLVGYRKVKSKQVPFIELSSILLIYWGLLVSWFVVSFWNSEVLPWSMEPGVRELTIWDHLQFATWGLKGLLWIASGLIFIATSLIQRRLKPKLNRNLSEKQLSVASEPSLLRPP